MQEQRPYKMTPDQGWSQMAAILDEAMPVVRRSRRTVIYWWAAAAVISVAIIGLMTMVDINTSPGHQHASQQSKDGQETMNSDVIANSKQNSNSATNTNETTLDKIDSEVHNSKDLAMNSSKDLTIQTDEVATNNQSQSESNNSIAKHNQSSSHNNSTLGFQSEKDLLAISDVIQSDKIDETLRETLTEPFYDLSDTRADMVDEVAFLPMTPFEELDIHVNSDISANPDIKHPSKFRPHLALGLLRSFSNGLGINFGGGLNVRLGNKVSLTGDVAYQFYDTNASLSFGSKDVEQNYNPIIREDLAYLGYGEYLPADVINTSSNQTISPLVKDLHQWQLSGGVRYNVSRKFFAEAGATLNFGIIAHSSYPIIAHDSNAPATGDFFNISNSFNTYDIVKSTTASLYGGIGYRLNPNTEVFAQVIQGLDHYLLNSETLPSAESTKRTDLIRGINVGLRQHLIAGP